MALVIKKHRLDNSGVFSLETINYQTTVKLEKYPSK